MSRTKLIVAYLITMACLFCGCTTAKPAPHNRVYVVAPANAVASEQQPSPEEVEQSIPEMKAYRLQNFLPASTTRTTEGQVTIGGFPVIEEVTVADPSLRNEVLSLFSREENFNDRGRDCFYPELAFSFPPALAEDLVDAQRHPTDGASLTILVSLSCNRVKALGFTWPHAGSGVEDEATTRLAEIVDAIFSDL